MCLLEAPDDIVCRYVTHAFACGYKKVACLRSSRQDPDHQRRYWSLLTSVRTCHGITHVLPKRKRLNRQSRLSPVFIGQDDWI